MKNDSGKVILSLLAGATAGIVTGLLMAPETGEETRATLRKSAGRFSEDLSKLLKEGLAKLNDLKTGGVPTEHADARSAADDLLQSMGSTSTSNAEPAVASAPRTTAKAPAAAPDAMSDDVRLGE